MGKKTAKKQMGRPPKQGDKKDDRLIVATETVRKNRYVRAAEREGMELSEWVRHHLDRVADQVLGEGK